MTARTPELVSEFDPQSPASVYRLQSAVRAAEDERHAQVDQAVLIYRAATEIRRSIHAAARLITAAVLRDGTLGSPTGRIERDTAAEAIKQLVSNAVPWLRLSDTKESQTETRSRLAEKWKAAFGDPDKDPEVVKKYAATLRMLRGSQPG